MLKKLAVILMFTLFSTINVHGKVNWQPGQGKSDPSWYAHYTHVSERNGKDSGLVNLNNSITELCDKLSRDYFAELYADLGVNIAKIGITRLGWQLGRDMKDPSWYAHYTHVKERSTKEDGRDKLKSWFRTLHQSLDTEGFAILYADAMTRMASYGLTR